jgi:hypothetical protein
MNGLSIRLWAPASDSTGVVAAAVVGEFHHRSSMIVDVSTASQPPASARTKRQGVGMEEHNGVLEEL